MNTEFILRQVLEGLDEVEGAGISTGGHLLTDLRYTDGTTLFATTSDKCSKYQSVKAISAKYGLSLNVAKQNACTLM